MGEERDKNNRDALLCTIPTMKSENLNKTTCEEGGGRVEFGEGDTRDATLVFVAFGASGIARGEVDGFTLHTVPFATENVTRTVSHSPHSCRTCMHSSFALRNISFFSGPPPPLPPATDTPGVTAGTAAATGR